MFKCIYICVYICSYLNLYMCILCVYVNAYVYHFPKLSHSGTDASTLYTSVLHAYMNRFAHIFTYMYTRTCDCGYAYVCTYGCYIYLYHGIRLPPKPWWIIRCPLVKQIQTMLGQRRQLLEFSVVLDCMHKQLCVHLYVCPCTYAYPHIHIHNTTQHRQHAELPHRIT